LGAALGGARLWVKRDDQTGLGLGGNKTRKLEYLLAEAQAHGARTLITAGAIQSNHCRQTAAAAARFGFGCILVLAGQPDEIPSGNLLLDQLFDAEIVWAESTRTRDEVLNAAFREAWDTGRRPYLIPYGGSNPLGAVAYVNALHEFLEQGLQVDTIVFASSSGGTQAGLVVGARAFGFRGQILGVSVDEGQETLQKRVADLSNATAEYLDLPERFEPGEIEVNAGYLGGGYGVMGEPERQAIQLFARTEGLLVDPVYTGRAAAALLDLYRIGTLRKDQNVLFWHTGGTPALFAGRYRPGDEV
jgi:D-cysteine desulfhydrase family pyridoxal phosphate-dependent enzyme